MIDQSFLLMVLIALMIIVIGWGLLKWSVSVARFLIRLALLFAVGYLLYSWAWPVLWG